LDATLALVRLPQLLATLSVIGLLASACSGSPTISEESPAPGVGVTTATTDAGGLVDPWPVAISDLAAETSARWGLEIVRRVAHDPNAFTQGLEVHDTYWLESTGLYGQSTLRRVDPQSGTSSSVVSLPPEVFAEGLTVWNDTIIQLTWQSGIAYRWDVSTLESLEPFAYQGEGWGLCATDHELVMSNGSDQITWRDPGTFEVVRTATVTLDGAPISQLNELECVGDIVLANVWKDDRILVINSDGEVLAVIDGSNLVNTVNVAEPGRDVLNGIADLGDGTVLIGGKNWPEFFVARIIEQ